MAADPDVEAEAEGDDLKLPHRFPVEGQGPPPPDDLWDTTETQLLELVKCEAFVRVAVIDPKQGMFRVRMKCMWSFRTLNSREDTEVQLRGVPGIRMPGLMEVVEESRIWKDISSARTTKKTVFWKGISLFTMDGFKAFQMQQFPLDRHLLNLEKLEFVWRPHKDARDYYKSMHVVSFTVHTSSMLPEWKVCKAYVKCLDQQHVTRKQPRLIRDGVAAKREEVGQTVHYGSKFTVQLRIQRLYEFYFLQVFLVTYLITCLSCTPLGMHPGHIGDRLAVYAGGVLTLVAFKYSVSDHMPSVPYMTLTDKVLIAQMMTVCLCSLFSITTYRLVRRYADWSRFIDWFENAVALVSLIVWSLVMLTLTSKSRVKIWRKKWPQISQEDDDAQDNFAKNDHPLSRR